VTAATCSPTSEEELLQVGAQASTHLTSFFLPIFGPRISGMEWL
jgi:hypothetical protein